MPLVPASSAGPRGRTGYGVAAFTSHMEQIQAIMERPRPPTRRSSCRRRAVPASYSQDAYLRHLMLAAAELYPRFRGHAPGSPAISVATCLSAIQKDSPPS